MNENSLIQASSNPELQPETVPKPVPDTPATPQKPPRPRACRVYIRREAARAWPVIVNSLIGKAKEGSVPHTSLVAKLAGFEQRPEPPREPKRRKKGLARRLLEEMQEHEARNIAEFGE